MQDRLKQLIETHGVKQWANYARKDLEFVAWVEAQTAHIADLTFPERVYTACHGVGPVCDRGGRRTFNSIEKGWRYCGRANACPCAAEAVAAACKTASARTSDEQVAINAKRAATNLDRYGHENVGQGPAAKAAHAAFYGDPDKVAQAVEKGRASMLAAHGVDNALKLPKVNEHRKTIAANLSDAARSNIKRIRAAQRDDGRYLSLSFDKLAEKFAALGYDWLADKASYSGIYGASGRERFPFRCRGCGHEFFAYIYDGWRPECETCHPPPPPSFYSKQEQAVGDFIESLGVDIVRRSRSVLASGIELDIFVPQTRLAVEFCGLYWHAEFASQARGDSPKGKTYHLAKHDACAAAGIRLITIFSDEWQTKRILVEKRLRHLLGTSETRIQARQTRCRAIDHTMSSDFLERHHVQGAGTPAAVRLGLFHDDRLVAVMTFGQPRRSNNHKASEGSWELYRFASEGAVVGGASKLFTAFVRQYAPTVVRTFADRRWGEGRGYLNLGFVPDGLSEPGYWYVGNHYSVRHHRYNFAKHALVKDGFDPALTELQIMRDRGFDVIWDCGNAKYIWQSG